MQCTEAGVTIAWRLKVEHTHTLLEEGELPEIGIDYGFFDVGTVQLDASVRQLLTGRVRQTTQVRS